MLSLLVKMTTTIEMTVNVENDDDDDDDNNNNNNSVVSVMPKLWSRRPGDRIPAGERNVPVLQNAQTGSGAHAEREVEHSPPFNGEVKNEWSYSSTQVYTALLRKRDETLTEEVK